MVFNHDLIIYIGFIHITDANTATDYATLKTC